MSVFTQLNLNRHDGKVLRVCAAKRENIGVVRDVYVGNPEGGKY